MRLMFIGIDWEYAQNEEMTSYFLTEIWNDRWLIAKPNES